RFEITAGSRLVAEIADHDALHVLLGKPTPCVGREQELATLEATPFVKLAKAVKAELEREAEIALTVLEPAATRFEVLYAV
ncbi:MAG TPA: hypothetical protein VFV62_11960, partial [Gaiellaceae bacterium]|nr:hypothetical protein [Gaiellaceae bacterium]